MINGVPRILIIRLSAIGDVVRVLPALHTLRKAHPDAQIDWAIEPKAAELVTGHPALDRVLVFDRPGGFFQGVGAFLDFCKRIRLAHYDIVIDFHGVLKSGLIAACSGTPDRYGFTRPRGREGSYLFLNRKVKLASDRLNRVEENLVLCDAVVPGHRTLDATIYVPQEVQEDVDAFYESTFDGGKLVVAMHAPVDRADKRWPTAHFAALADLLLADGRFEVMLTWGPGQFGVVEEVLAESQRSPVVAPETTTLKQCAWVMHRAALYFGGDTGPMHIASVMGTPVVAVFGGTDPGRHAPYRKPCEVLYIEGGSKPLSAEERLRRVTPAMAYDACVRAVTADERP